MIPKRAIFFWEGPEMSWLRKQSLETFRLCNPGWEVVVINGDGLPIKKDGLLSIVHRSDWARYRELHFNGGFYFDTDMVFHKPMPQAFVDAELVLPIPEKERGRVGNIATLGCQPGEPFFADACQVCENTHKSARFLNYQAFGVVALKGALSLLAGRDVTWITDDLFVPIPWDQTERLWNKHSGGMIPISLGVHWFGGDHLSRSVEEIADEAWLAESDCLVAKTIRRARERAAGDGAVRGPGSPQVVQVGQVQPQHACDCDRVCGVTDKQCGAC